MKFNYHIVFFQDKPNYFESEHNNVICTLLILNMLTLILDMCCSINTAMHCTNFTLAKHNFKWILYILYVFNCIYVHM